MILLDTNALIWFATAHPRAGRLRAQPQPLFVSPVSLLELRFLEEVGRVQIAPGHSLSELASVAGLEIDSPPSKDLFGAALDVGWTRDPFDRLLVAHARCRSVPIATGDRNLLTHLGPEEVFQL